MYVFTISLQLYSPFREGSRIRHSFGICMYWHCLRQMLLPARMIHEAYSAMQGLCSPTWHCPILTTFLQPGVQPQLCTVCAVSSSPQQNDAAWDVAPGWHICLKIQFVRCGVEPHMQQFSCLSAQKDQLQQGTRPLRYKPDPLLSVGSHLG